VQLKGHDASLWSLERLIFSGIHRPLGLRCVAHSAGKSHLKRYYTLESTLGIRPIDRMNTWGGRRPDGMHPTFAAQYGTVRLLLSGVCSPSGDASAATDRGKPRT